MREHDDALWSELQSAHRHPYDPRPAIRKLATRDRSAWTELWNQLHHQGDVDTASFAAVAELVRAYDVVKLDWNFFALVATVELERNQRSNPQIPTWIEPAYRDALRETDRLALDALALSDDPLVARSALAIVAISKGLRSHARVLLELDQSEVEEIFALS